MTSSEYRLGRSLVEIIPFYRRIQQKEFITNKILIIMAVIVVVKIAILLTWR
jgi:hypothetical protein